MLKLKDNITLKQIKDYGFITENYELLFKIKRGYYLAFDSNTLSDDYLHYIGIEQFNTLDSPSTEEQEQAFKKIEELLEKVEEETDD